MTGAQLLDDQSWLTQQDPSGMLGLVEGLPAQCREAERIARSVPLPDWPKPCNVVVLGMGGSAIGGDLVRGLAAEQCSVPVLVNRDYSLPRYVTAGSLVIASSYSGNTEETLTGYARAKERGARIVAITAGGELARLATADGWPVLRIPGGLSPRAAIGYSFVPLLVTLERLGLLPPQEEALAETVKVLERQRERLGREVRVEQNPAKALALALVGNAPLILGSEGWKGVAAYRWKCQVNENSKVPAFWNVFPELNHNETVGWEASKEVLQRLHVVVLRDSKDNPRNARRVEVTKSIMGRSAAGVTEFWAEGESALARLFSLIYPGDFATVYLALLNGIDPTPVKAIDYLKSELQRV